jgi:hypothetical protein
MKISFSLVTASLLLLSLVPVRADTIYPRVPCRVFDDAAFTQVQFQCGTDLPFYPRKLFVQSSKKRSYHHYLNYKPVLVTRRK